MVIGAGWAGARAMTATAGPGISLMPSSPVSRTTRKLPRSSSTSSVSARRPGLSDPDRAGDMLFTAFLSHGDPKHVMIIPSGRGMLRDGAAGFELTELSQTAGVRDARTSTSG
jgi:2-oxoglutarate ferredoxin oxidoreductase subunit alpha